MPVRLAPFVHHLHAFGPGAFVRPWISSGLYVFVALMWLVLDRRIERVLVKREQE